MRLRKVYNFTIDNQLMEQFREKTGRVPMSQAIESFIIQYLAGEVEIV